MHTVTLMRCEGHGGKDLLEEGRGCRSRVICQSRGIIACGDWGHRGMKELPTRKTSVSQSTFQQGAEYILSFHTDINDVSAMSDVRMPMTIE